MKKIFKVAHLRDLEKQVAMGKISYSKKVEILNVMANNAFLHSVSHWVAAPEMPNFDGGYIGFIEQPQECGNVWHYQKTIECVNNEWVLDKDEAVIHWHKLLELP